VDAASGLVSVNGLSGLFTGARPVVETVGLQTGPSTTFNGFSIADFGAIDVGNYVAAKGPLFSTTEGNVVGALEVRSLSVGN
jgi:hypothetical protein